jgi:GNAT superfamily N-acetyltransferase
LELWNCEYPSAIIYHSVGQLDDYLDKLSDTHHYFLIQDEYLTGWAITFTRDDEKWFAIIVDKSVQGKGAGSFILNRLKKDHTRLNGWVINEDGYFKQDGTAYKAPLHFYLKNGFTLVEKERLDIQQMKAVKIYWQEEIESHDEMMPDM